MGLGLNYTVGIALGASVGMSFLTGALEGLSYGLMLSGGLAALVGLCWLIMIAAKGKKNKGSQTQFAVAVLVSGLALGGTGGGIYATTDFRSGPLGPGNDAPAAKAK
jgi:hypothetical protein